MRRCPVDPARCPNRSVDYPWAPACMLPSVVRHQLEEFVTPRRGAHGCLLYPIDEVCLDLLDVGPIGVNSLTEEVEA